MLLLKALDINKFLLFKEQRLFTPESSNLYADNGTEQSLSYNNNN